MVAEWRGELNRLRSLGGRLVLGGRHHQGGKNKAEASPEFNFMVGQFISGEL